MARAFSLQPLQKLAQQRNEAAGKKLGLLNRNRQAAQSKLDMLQQYRRDYLDKMQQAEQNGMGLHELKNFREFICRLDEAIKHQDNVLEQAHDSVKLGVHELQETQRRKKSFDALEQRHIESERNREHKLEQKVQDEHSSRRAAYNRSALDDNE